MVIFSVVALFAIIFGAYFFARRIRDSVPVFVNGLIPSLPGAEDKQEHGTTVYIFYSDTERDEPEREIFRGYADEKGTVQASIPYKEVGRPVTVRIRHAGFKFKDHDLTVPKHGIIFTAEMTRDGVYSGTVRGAQVTNLAQHHAEASSFADEVRTDAFRLARSVGKNLGRIPTLFWPLAYILIIIAFAADYYFGSSGFKVPFESFAHALYFSTVTITTLGYGDTYPTSDIPRLLCSLQAVVGIIIIGLFLNSLFYERS